jgi:LysM repeat protein
VNRRLFRGRWLLIALALALSGASACSDSDGDPPQAFDSSEVPTATLPNPLPEPIVLGRTEPQGTGATYTVQPGDSPASIAAQFGITAEELMQANGIADPTSLFVGQVLTVPAGAATAPTEQPPPPAATPTPPPAVEGQQTYTVVSGDYAEAIAQRFGITVEELAAANNTTVDDLRTLSVGDVLIIPPPSGVAP